MMIKDPLEAKESLIRNILELRIRPVLQAHGGDVQYVKYENGIVWVELKGACDGCSHALETLKGDVQHFLKLIIPEVESVKDIHLERLNKKDD